MFRRIGIDKSIAYSSGAKVVGGITGIITIFFLTTFLTGAEQGFYYTFGSLLAMQVFFELGLTGIMTQFVAHESAHLTLNDKGQYEGSDYYRSRLASLVQFCVKWYSILSVVAFVFLTIVGFVYFDKYGSNESDVDWQIPWVLVCIGTCIRIFQSPFNSILMGLGKVKEMSMIGFYSQLIQPISIWICLVLGLNLYCAGISCIISVGLWQILVDKEGLTKLILNLYKIRVNERVAYLKEIFPFQWKIALSWVSGYFIFQLFNPVLFATDGAIVAGQMGMTLQGLNAIEAFSYSWIGTKIPRFSGLIALKNYEELDSLFSKTKRQMVAVCSFLLAVFFLFVFILKETKFEIMGNIIGDRFLDYLPMALMVFPVFLMQFTNCWATYLRCHKEEPFLYNSIVTGVLCLLSTFFLGRKFGIYGVTVGYCTIQTVLFPWGYYLYKTYKRKWHNER